MKDTKGASKQETHILNKLRLKQIYNGAFVENTSEMKDKLRLVSNYVVFGYLSKRIISTLFTSRGNINEEGKKVAISDNNKIEERYGDDDVLCLDDIVEAYANFDEKLFAKINPDLWAFQVSPNTEFIEKFQATEKTTARGGLLGYHQTSSLDSIVEELL